MVAAAARAMHMLSSCHYHPFHLSTYTVMAGWNEAGVFLAGVEKANGSPIIQFGGYSPIAPNGLFFIFGNLKPRGKER